MRGADPFQKIIRVAIAAKQRVLPVVDGLSALPVDERRRPAAEARRLFEHDDATSPLGQPDGRTQPGESAADDNGVGMAWKRRLPGHLRAHHVRAARPAWRGRGTRMTLENTSNSAASIRSSRSK